MEDPVNADPMDLCPSDAQIMESPPKDFNSLTDIYWVRFFFFFFLSMLFNSFSNPSLQGTLLSFD